MEFLKGLVDVVKGVLKREAARLIAYSGVVATGAALWVATQLGVELSEGFLAAVAVFAAAVATELIRVFVYSEETVEQIVEEVKDESQETP